MGDDREDRMARACAAAKCGRAAADLLIAGLDHAVCNIKIRRHVTAEELLAGIACVALDQFGLLASAVLRELGIETGIDVGSLAHEMVVEGLLVKGENDSQKDFGPVSGQLQVFIRNCARVLESAWGGAWRT